MLLCTIRNNMAESEITEINEVNRLGQTICISIIEIRIRKHCISFQNYFWDKHIKDGVFVTIATLPEQFVTVFTEKKT